MNKRILSDESLIEDYEDLVFKKVFAIRCKEESEKIFDEIKEREKKENSGKRIVEKLFNRKERKENLDTLGNIFKKGFVFVASFILVTMISISSAVVAFADIRDVVTDIIYHLIFEENERYTIISAAETTEFIDPELYDWEGAYAPTYMPDGGEFVERIDFKNKHTVYYVLDKKDIVITQFTDCEYKIDTEEAEVIEYTTINGSNAVIVTKENYSIVCWSADQIMMHIRGDIATDELIKIAESMRAIK